MLSLLSNNVLQSMNDILRYYMTSKLSLRTYVCVNPYNNVILYPQRQARPVPMFCNIFSWFGTIRFYFTYNRHAKPNHSSLRPIVTQLYMQLVAIFIRFTFFLIFRNCNTNWFCFYINDKCLTIHQTPHRYVITEAFFHTKILQIMLISYCQLFKTFTS